MISALVHSPLNSQKTNFLFYRLQTLLNLCANALFVVRGAEDEKLFAHLLDIAAEVCQVTVALHVASRGLDTIRHNIWTPFHVTSADVF